MRRRQPIYNNTLPIVKKRLYCLSLLMTDRERQSSDSSLVATFTTALFTAPSVPSRNESLMMSPTETTRFPIIALTAKFVSSVRSHGERRRRRLDRSRRRREGGCRSHVNENECTSRLIYIVGACGSIVRILQSRGGFSINWIDWLFLRYQYSCHLYRY